MKISPLGIQGKFLLLYGLGLVLVVGFSFLVQRIAYQAGTEFEVRLGYYYAAQGLRTSLTTLRKDAEQLVRDPVGTPQERLNQAWAALDSLAGQIRILEDQEGEIAFRAVSVRRGLAEYHRLLAVSLAAGERGDPRAYERYQEADRIAAYVDGYLGALLSASLEEGTEWYQATAQTNETWRQITFGGNLLVLVVAVILAWLLSTSIARPIRQLAAASRKMAAGDLDVEPVEARTGDEVEVLATSFSAMSANIRELVAGIQEKAQLESKIHEDELALVALDRDLKEARFFALQSRLRPHFLFNALNTLARTALLEGAQETERISRSLAALMRYSLGAGENWVRIEEELGILKEYLSFQGIRFGERLTWFIEADPETVRAVIPRFLLQPLVENAVLHGIEPKIEGGRVGVLVRAGRQRVRLAVWDNGTGMDAATRDRVRAGFRTQTSPTGVGTSGLWDRLTHRYGDHVRTALYSQPGRGTLIVLSIPEEAFHGSSNSDR